MNYRSHHILFVFWTFCIFLCLSDKYDEEQYGVKYADDCEVCKIVSHELTSMLDQSKGKHEVLETGYSVEKAKKKTKYAKSELRLIETIDTVCEKLLEYNVHKERKDSTRFARGTSETFQALDGLVAKGMILFFHEFVFELEAKTKCISSTPIHYYYFFLFKVSKLILEYHKNYGTNHQLK